MQLLKGDHEQNYTRSKKLQDKAFSNVVTFHNAFDTLYLVATQYTIQVLKQNKLRNEEL